MMKKLFLIFLPLLALANPSWLFNIIETNRFEIIGYGMDKSLSTAKQNAISDITNSISVSVKSSVDISNSDVNGQMDSSSSINLKTTSQAVLSGVEFIKAEQSDGIWYVAAKYDNSPIEIKLKKSLPHKIKDEIQNLYLRHTSLFKKINGEINTKLNYQITRKDNLWQLRYKDILIPINQDNFYELFSNQKNKSITLILNQKIYKENDEMYFHIKQKKAGYISILYVEHDGKVGVLLANHKSAGTFIYPDAKQEEAFKIANPYNKPIQELYVAIYSTLPIDLSDFENVSDTVMDESNYNFDKLISKLNNVDFSTVVIKIKK